MSTKSLYTFKIFIVGGPMSEKFMKKNPVVSRTIQMRGNHTLEKLHDAMFKAFNREEAHMYEFQIGGKGPMDPDAKRYVMSAAFEMDDFKADGDVSKTTIASLNLKERDLFGYWFDFGDDWWHQVGVLEITDEIPKGNRYPKVIEKEGASPPQYDDFD